MKRKIEYYNNIELKRIKANQVDYILKNRSKYKGLYIYIIPSNMRIDTEWYRPFILEIDNYRDYIDYINEINEIIFYNCNNELGKDLYFYIESGKIC